MNTLLIKVEGDLPYAFDDVKGISVLPNRNLGMTELSAEIGINTTEDLKRASELCYAASNVETVAVKIISNDNENWYLANPDAVAALARYPHSLLESSISETVLAITEAVGVNTKDVFWLVVRESKIAYANDTFGFSSLEEIEMLLMVETYMSVGVSVKSKMGF